jgi:hypothetical protein
MLCCDMSLWFQSAFMGRFRAELSVDNAAGFVPNRDLATTGS